MLTRTLTVYPADHPRSRSAAAAAVATLGGDAQATTLAVFDGALHTDAGQAVTGPHGDWLAERLREATLRAIVFQPTCTADDMLAFAHQLVLARQQRHAGLAAPWPESHPRLQAVPLAFHGTYDGQGNRDSGSPDAAATTAGVQGAGAAGLASAQVIASRYFARDDIPATTAIALPQGRPEDGRITADLDAMRTEFAELQRNGRTTATGDIAGHLTADVVAREVLGVLLHLFATAGADAQADAVGQPLRRTLAKLGDGATGLLDVYLQSARQTLPAEARIRLLAEVHAAGLSDRIERQGWLDVTTFVQGFPQVLPLALRALGGSPQGMLRVRTALDLVAQQLGRTALQFAIADDVLRDPELLPRLLALGEPLASEIFVRVTAAPSPALIPALVAHARTFALAEPERIALAHLDADAPHAAEFLTALHAHGNRRPVAAALRQGSGAVLRRRVLTARDAGDEALLLHAIADLVHVPEDPTRRLLRELAGRYRLPGWIDRNAAVKAAARRVLATMKP